MRFLHTADWQIGRAYGQFGVEAAAALAAARIAAVETLARLATEHAVAAVLVAGDVFDFQAVSEKTQRRLFNAMAGYTGPWLLIPGNHDAALADGAWRRSQRLGLLPPNVRVSLAPEVLDYSAEGFVVLTAPLTQRMTSDDLTAWFAGEETPAGALRIGLAHGSVQGLLPEGIDSPNPIAPDRSESARLDYLALGDWHGRKPVGPRAGYSGTPEPDRFKDNDPGLALLVTLDGPGALPQVQALPVARYRWQRWAHRVAEASDLDALAARFRTEVDAGTVLDLTLEGSADLASLSRLDALLGEAEARACALVVHRDALLLAPTEADIEALAADGYVGEVIRELRDLQGQPQGTVAGKALAVLASLLQGREGAAAGAGA